MRCPSCGNELSHRDLRTKKCKSCGYFLPVIATGKKGVANKKRPSKLPPPSRRPHSFGNLKVNSMSQAETYKSGEVLTNDNYKEVYVSGEPSIATDDDDSGVIIPDKSPVPQTPPGKQPRSSMPAGHKKKGEVLPPPPDSDKLKGSASKRYGIPGLGAKNEKTMKVRVIPPPQQNNTSGESILKDLILIVGIILFVLSLTFLVITIIK
ncbi:MAG: hypothetical protein ACQES9_03435 [Myxococcota bacterium]